MSVNTRKMEDGANEVMKVMPNYIKIAEPSADFNLTEMADMKENAEHSNNMIAVLLNSKSKRYPMETLCKFPYFKPYFEHFHQAKRNQRKNSNTADGQRKFTKIVKVGNNMLFDLSHFDELVSIERTKRINGNFDIKQIESLLECDLHFGAKCIKREMIRSYLELSINSIACIVVT